MKKYKTLVAIITNETGEILLTKRARAPYKSFWALPSGIGEDKKGITPEIGIVEEVRCDLGTDSFVGDFLFSMAIKNDKFTDMALVFEGKINEKEIEVQKEFSQGYAWFSIGQVLDLELAFEHPAIIKKYAKLIVAKQ